MSESVITFIVLRGELERQVAELAATHAAFEPWCRRVLIDGDDTFARRVAADAVALTVRPDGSICDVLVRAKALSGAWIETAFVRGKRAVEGRGGLVGQAGFEPATT